MEAIWQRKRLMAEYGELLKLAAMVALALIDRWLKTEGERKALDEISRYKEIEQAVATGDDDRASALFELILREDAVYPGRL